jgi:hypothetical protein
MDVRFLIAGEECIIAESRHLIAPLYILLCTVIIIDILLSVNRICRDIWLEFLRRKKYNTSKAVQDLLQKEQK